MPAEYVGYASSAILLVTIGSQLWKQWHSGTSSGVSRYLFIGQFLASCGFVFYSALVGDAIFVVTNASLALAAIVGIAIVTHHQRRAGGRRSTEAVSLSRIPIPQE